MQPADWDYAVSYTSIFIIWAVSRLCQKASCTNLSGLDLLFSAKDCLEDSPDQRLYEKELCKKCKRQIKTHQFQPICQQCDQVKALVVGIIKTRGQKAHGRAHQAHGCTYDRALEEHRMGLSRIKVLTGEPEGCGADRKSTRLNSSHA